jgi:hypothetical protein
MNSAVKRILLAAGMVLLVGAVGIAQTETSGISSKTKKRRSTYSSTSSAQNGSSSTANSTSNADPSTPSSSAAASQSGGALPQSDSASAAAASNTPATDGGGSGTVKAGNSGFDDTSSPQNGTSSSAQSSQASPSTAGQGSPAPSGSEASSSNDISNGPVAETVSDSNALIGWATRNAASNTAVKYGMNRANLSQTAQGTDGSDGKNHHAKMEGLSPNTRYYFQITENGQPVGGVGTFRTTAAGEQPVQSKAVIPQK